MWELERRSFEIIKAEKKKVNEKDWKIAHIIYETLSREAVFSLWESWKEKKIEKGV